MRSRMGRGAVEIVAGAALGIVAMAVADSATTSVNLRLLVAVTVCVAGVVAEWGLRHAAHKVRNTNQSSVRQESNPSSSELTRRNSHG